MVVYQGGKSRLGKRIHDVICLLEEYLYVHDHKNDKKYSKCDYFEPFVGMAGVLTHFGKDNDRYLFACDANKDIILMWQALQRGWLPPVSCTRKKYESLKVSPTHSAERGFIGTVASWGGIFFHAYRLDYNKNKDYVGEGYRSILKLLPFLVKVEFLDPASYDEFEPEGMVIYADPPYQGNALGNKTSSLFRKFDHTKFWNTMRLWSKNNLVVVSEWQAPSDFKQIWSANGTVSSGQGRKAKKFQDNLYVHESVYNMIDSKVIELLKTV